MSRAVHLRSCHLCEAMCGVALTVEGERVTEVRGDPDDPHSRGYICPKALAIADVHHDPDRLTTPRVRRGDRFEPIEWDAALDLVARRLRDIRRAHGNDAIAVYQGNPTAHNLGLMTFGQAFFRSLGTRNLYSATSADQLPHMLAALLMFGHQVLLTVPDLDRTDFMLLLGANPAVSNGSMMSAPDMRRRLAAIRARGGHVVTVDPRRGETARLADQHIFIRPGQDALLLLGLLHTVFAEGLTRRTVEADGWDTVARLVAGYAPERVAAPTGVPADTIRDLARAFASAGSAVAYGRLGVSVQAFGGVCAWLVNLLNAVTGNLDRAGGAMFTTPAVDAIGITRRLGHRGGFDRYRSRVSRLPEFGGELPVAVLAEEIETPGAGQIRALITSAGNPVLSTPNGGRLERALATLDFHVALDFYIGETSRLADVILPPTFALERDHYDVGLNVVAVRNLARWSPALFPRRADQRHDWEICLELAARMRLPGPLRRLAVGVGRALGPNGVLDLALRAGPYRGVSLAALRRAPRGLDFGPLEPRLAKVLDRRIDLAPAPFVADLARLEATLTAPAAPLVLIGRRALSSNNSWLHNSPRLVKGARCTLVVHPDDGARLGLTDGGQARVRSRVGEVTAPVELSDEVMPGVVSLPHGWGHGRPGVALGVAAAHPGVSVNDLTDERFVDRLSGTAAFNGVAVEVEPA